MVAAEPLTPTAPRPAGRTLSTQRWRDVTFLHWAVDPERVAPLLPPGTVPDVHEGATYVGLVPFRMDRVGLLGAPAPPWLGSFAETNVRLYSVDDRGRRGVVFRSLDAERLLLVLAGRRAARLPYAWSRMRIERDGDVLTYTSRRRLPGPRGAGSRVVVRVRGRLSDVDPLARFLTARWGLHRPGRHGPVYWPNEHGEWPLHRADLLDLQESLLAAAGLEPATRPPDIVLFSPGVAARFGPPLPTRPAPGPSRRGRSPRG